MPLAMIANGEEKLSRERAKRNENPKRMRSSAQKAAPGGSGRSCFILLSDGLNLGREAIGQGSHFSERRSTQLIIHLLCPRIVNEPSTLVQSPSSEPRKVACSSSEVWNRRFITELRGGARSK